MKKFTLALAALVLVGPAFAATNNTIKMVSYFPIPYASYSDIAVDGTCDVGLLNKCSMSVPSWTIANTDLNGSGEFTAGDMIVKAGPLSLNSSYSASQVKGAELLVGSGTHGVATLKFDGNLNVTDTMLSNLSNLDATTKANIKSLTLGTHTFPACNYRNSSEITWRSLRVAGTNRVYLTCGGYEQLPKPCPGEDKRQCGCGPIFGGSYTYGTQTRTCNEDTGEWSEWGECTGYDKYARQQCEFGDDEERECRKQSNGNYDWVQVTQCSTEDPNAVYEWVVTGTDYCYMCGSCPSASPQGDCREAADEGKEGIGTCFNDSDTTTPGASAYSWEILTCERVR